MEENKKDTRVSKIEKYLLDPEKTIFEMLTDFEGSIEEIRNALSGVNIEELKTLRGDDGKTPIKGEDYFTDDELDMIEQFILDRIPTVGEEIPSKEQINKYIDKQVAKIPRVKGDKGEDGKNGKDGKNGSPDSALDIIKKIRSLGKNQGLQLDDIRGLNQKISLINSVSDEVETLKENIGKIKIYSGGPTGESSGGGAVSSVNGKTGVVVLTQDDISDGTNYVRTENNLSDSLLATFNAKEDSSNKSTDGTFADNSDVKYPSQKATKTYVDTKVGNAVRYQGAYDASGNTYPTTGGSGTAGAIMKGDMFVISVAGILGGVAVQVGDEIIANINTPGQTSSNWNTLNTNISYVPEDVANKKTTMTGNTTSDTFYLSAKAIYDWATGLFANIAGSISQAFSVSTLDVGNADTTISRASAGVIAVEGVTIPSISSTNTLINKRITPRVTSITSSATPTINTDNCDAVTITAQAEAITSMTTNLSGTPTNFQKLIIRIKDNGTERAITWGTSFEAKGVALPITTVASKVLTVKFIYDSVTSKWGCVSYVQEA